SQVDTACLDRLKNYRLVITMEDGIIDGGFGQKVASYLGSAPVRVIPLGLRKEFVDKFSVRELLDANGLTAEKVAEAAME
ncbi:MAG: 1-deoxy-D-xylulose-5-phosphate synthase, partial [Muribaculaceae bacterium]|nr:1-deoxy-D-xylulose-5-phosphate synthase [Muribaculaceae bacterium]